LTRLKTDSALTTIKPLSVASPEGKSYTSTMPVEIVRRKAGVTFSSRGLKRIALKILQLVGQSRSELSVALVNNKEIRKLNAKYRQKDYPTDVLSFPAANGLPINVCLLGDVVISVEKAEEQAKERGRTLSEETITLLIHGVLHLLGYDHERSLKDARIMGRLEKKIYRTLCEQGILRV
jgi:probable rRNA maturation factor